MVLPFQQLLKTISPSGKGSTSSNYNTYLRSVKDNTTVFTPKAKSYDLKYLQYPVDAGDQKHYILFDILRREGVGSQVQSNATRQPSSTGNDAYLKKIYQGANRFYSEELFSKGNSEKREIVASIALYMPQNIKLGFTADYGAEDQGIFSGLGSKIREALTPDGMDTSFFKNLLAQSAKNISNVTSLVGFEGAGTANVQRKFGIAAAPLQEMIFNQLEYRSFSFDFKFTPRSADESILLKEILDTMKIAMLPTKVGKGSAIAAYEVPDEFAIRFMHGQQMNPFIDVVGLCACTGIDVTYGGDKFATHAGGDPVTINVSMAFKELEIIERQRYAELKGIKLTQESQKEYGYVPDYSGDGY